MRRRGKGEGSIYQIRDGRWRAAVVLTDGRRKYVSAATREEVAKKCGSFSGSRTTGCR